MLKIIHVDNHVTMAMGKCLNQLAPKEIGMFKFVRFLCCILKAYFKIAGGPGDIVKLKWLLQNVANLLKYMDTNNCLLVLSNYIKVDYLK